MQSSTLPSEQDLAQQLEKTLGKLKDDPSSITTEDARRLSEHCDAHDTRSARIISAVEALAIANVEVHDQNPSLGQELHTSLTTLAKDLHAAVTLKPDDVTLEVLRTTQTVLSKMQKAVGHTNPPHPEVEIELQEELAKVERKIEQGTVTKAEADRLHSLEARAHGHTEKGGITATAQSVAAKRERQLSLGAASEAGAGRERTGSKSFPSALTPEKEKATRGEEHESQKSSLGVRVDRTNSSREVSGGKALGANVEEMKPKTKIEGKGENIGKKIDACECCHDGEVDRDDHIAAIVAKPHTREESQHVFGP
ncbi:hypothetical protein T440DRAFT_153776 [Plenodomus tracheiphilus IPT5]|uniref:SMP domain-containing protein n=1 Tax=Plenodomus tracheiphilus IPT5 TaxID=1408161 RepID=A0A6A7BJI4_9PLEO|nr:hypothetical protein T440DRAFT_153776 [Plenodomus tracheiphilus IPT5]